MNPEKKILTNLPQKGSSLQENQTQQSLQLLLTEATNIQQKIAQETNPNVIETLKATLRKIHKAQGAADTRYAVAKTEINVVGGNGVIVDPTYYGGNERIDRNKNFSNHIGTGRFNRDSGPYVDPNR